MKEIHIREHILKGGKKSYEYRFECCSIDGQRKWATKSGFKTKSEAKKAGLLAQQQYETVGQIVSPSDMSFSDFLDLWMEQDCKSAAYRFDGSNPSSPTKFRKLLVFNGFRDFILPVLGHLFFKKSQKTLK